MIVTCQYCQSAAVLCDSSEVYGPAYAGRFNVWRCSQYPVCDAYVGVHANSYNAAPMGPLANPALRKARRAAREAFEAFVKSNRMPKNKAYKELELITGKSRGRAHIGSFDEQECLKVVMGFTVQHELMGAK